MFGLLVVALVILCIVIVIIVAVRGLYEEYVYKSALSQHLPPGSMGWPYLGETLDLFSQNPTLFFKSRLSRYGEMFKTHILGCPSVIIGNPEGIKFILGNQDELFKCTFPKSKERMIGPEALFFHEGHYHLNLKRLLHSCFLPEAIRGSVPDIEAIAVHTLLSCEGKTVDSFLQMKKYAFNVGMHFIFGKGGSARVEKEEMEDAYGVVESCYNAMAINIPGTKFYKAIQARRRLDDMIRKAILERRQNGRRNPSSSSEKDLLGTLLEYKEPEGEVGGGLTDQQIADNIIGVLFASRDTTASILTWLLKYLNESHSVLQSIAVEQQGIRESKINGSQDLTWADTRAMPQSLRAIQETLRLASIISYTFREAVENVEYKGYVIPKGWKVMPLFRNIHHNPRFFPHPLHFDPSRFKEPPKPNTFLPFGSGRHSCPGNEVAKLEILIFLHHLTTKFRWEVMSSESGIQYGPFPVPKAGLPIQLTAIEPKVTHIT